MKTKTLVLTATLFTTLLYSCKKEDHTQPGVSYQLSTTNRTTTVSGTQSMAVTWNSGYAYSKKIEFEAQNAGGQVRFQSESIKKIDLFTPIGSFGSVMVPQGNYSQVEFQIELLQTATDAAFELRGNYNSTPIIFKINSAFELDADLSNVTVADGKAYTASIALNLANLTKGISSDMLNAATKDASGVILITASSNTSLYDTMVSNLHSIEGVQFN